MKRQPDPKEEIVLSDPGFVMTKTAVYAFDSATDQQIKNGFAKAVTMAGSAAWWIGDFGLVLQERRRRVLATEAAELRSRADKCTTDSEGVEAARRLIEKAEHLENLGVIEYTRDLCAVFRVSIGYVMNCVSWARFYEPSQRCENLTPAHHHVAMVAAGGAAGDKQEATALLREAQNANWTASELRKKVNLARATPEPNAAAAETPAYPELDAADAWAVANRDGLDRMSYEQLVRHVTQLQGLRDYIDNARRLLEAMAPHDARVEVMA